jgi:hypothetical protein
MTNLVNDEIEAVARAICKADMVMPDELSMASGKPRWTQYTRQAKAALAAIPPVNQEMLEALKQMKRRLEFFGENQAGKRYYMDWYGISHIVASAASGRGE